VTSDRRAWWALFAPLSAVVLWQAAWRRAGQYLLDGIVASPRVVLAAHVVAIALGAVLAARGRTVTPWRAPRLLLGLALATGLAPVIVQIAFDSERAIVVTLFGSAIIVGGLLGGLATTLARTLPGLAFPRERLLDALHVRPVAITIAVGVVFFVVAERVGPLRTTLALSVLAGLVAHVGASVLAPSAPASRRSRRVVAGSVYALVVVAIGAETIAPWLEATHYADAVVYGFTTAHGRVVLTSGRGAFQLYEGGAMRLSTIDAHRRREITAHPAMATARRHEAVLVIGGGEGLAVREILRYPDVGRVTVVEPDDALIHAATQQPIVLRENARALLDPRVTVVRADPLPWLRERDARWDVVVVDLPEPDAPARSKLFTTYFYRLVRAHLAPGGTGVVAGPSPTMLPRGWSSILASLRSAGLHPLPYHANLPTVGVMGYALISDHDVEAPRHVPVPCAWLDDDVLGEAFHLASDEVAPGDVAENLMWRQVLMRYRDEPLTWWHPLYGYTRRS
jgi:spermidine synthase